MITNIDLRSFKAFEKQSFEFKPLTIILGPNNSGKSSLLASIRMLIQTVESFDNKVPLLLNGKMGDFGTFKDIVFQNSKRRRIDINLTVNIENHRYFRGEADVHTVDLNLSFKYRTKRREIILSDAEVKYNGESLLVTEYNKDSETQLIQKITDKEVPSSLKSTISKRLRWQNFLPRYLGALYSNDENSALNEFLTKKIKSKALRLGRIAASVDHILKTTEYIGAMREAPSRTFLFTGERRGRVGVSGEHASNILAMDSARGGSKSLNIEKKVSKWFRKAEMADEISIETISDRHFEIRVRHPKTSEMENYADTGYGNSQILPVLIGGYNLNKNSTFLVEQPEIHLHPRAQSELADFFLELYNDDIQSVIETHSEHLVLRLQQYVASGQIPNEEIIFYYIYGTEEGKKVQALHLDNSGKFIEEWPEGFFPEKLEESKKLAKIRSKRN